jgi:hypothetical protein
MQPAVGEEKQRQDNEEFPQRNKNRPYDIHKSRSPSVCESRFYYNIV